jgi:hypothetical protein
MAKIKQSSFVIRRELKSCKTPRRNEDIQTVLDFHQRLYQWHSRIIHFVAHQMYTKPDDENRSFMYQVDSNRPPLFHHPILPIVIENNSTEASLLLPASHMDRILRGHKQLLQEKVDALQEVYPHPNDKPDTMLSVAETTLYLRLHHLNSLLVFHGQSVGHVGEMLRQQLAQAVGKQLQADDFHNYMRSFILQR